MIELAPALPGPEPSLLEGFRPILAMVPVDAVPTEVGELVRAAAEGSEVAWSSLVDRFAGLIWSVARSQGLTAADAADVSQTTWLRFAEHISDLRDPQRAAGWLVTTARREAIRVSRLGSRQTLMDPWAELTDEADESEVDGQLLEQERAALVHHAFALLPERCRQLLRALSDDPVSYSDISEQLDMPVGSIGPTRARCLGKLRALMDRIEIFHEDLPLPVQGNQP